MGVLLLVGRRKTGNDRVLAVIKAGCRSPEDAAAVKRLFCSSGYLSFSHVAAASFAKQDVETAAVRLFRSLRTFGSVQVQPGRLLQEKTSKSSPSLENLTPLLYRLIKQIKDEPFYL